MDVVIKIGWLGSFSKVGFYLIKSGYQIVEDLHEQNQAKNSKSLASLVNYVGTNVFGLLMFKANLSCLFGELAQTFFLVGKFCSKGK